MIKGSNSLKKKKNPWCNILPNARGRKRKNVSAWSTRTNLHPRLRAFSSTAFLRLTVETVWFSAMEPLKSAATMTAMSPDGCSNAISLSTNAAEIWSGGWQGPSDWPQKVRRSGWITSSVCVPGAPRTGGWGAKPLLEQPKSLQWAETIRAVYCLSTRHARSRKWLIKCCLFWRGRGSDWIGLGRNGSPG